MEQLSKNLESNDINKMLSNIVEEKHKLEKLTKKISDKATSKGKTQKTTQHYKLEVASPQQQPQQQPTDNKPTANANETQTELQAFKIQLDGEHEIKQQLQIKGEDFKNISKETVNKVLELLKNYVNMDKSFRLKHETLKTLYTAYLDLYKKYKEQQVVDTKANSLKETGTVDAANGVVVAVGDEKHSEMLKNIHSEMKENNSNLYRERLIILKKIKSTPDLDHQVKNKLCGRLIAIFKSPPIPDYEPLQLLMHRNGNGNGNGNDNRTSKGGDNAYSEEKISVNELDDAYLQKHNELLTVFKAYQNLYKKVLNYKEQLEKYKNLSTGSSITRCHMEKMIKDQRFVMDMIDKMQDNLVDNKIIDNSEKVLVTPVASNPDNMNAFSNTMREQIKHIIDRNIDINPNTRNKIDNLLSQYKECDSNDKFCTAGRKLILLKKM